MRKISFVVKEVYSDANGQSPYLRGKNCNLRIINKEKNVTKLRTSGLFTNIAFGGLDVTLKQQTDVNTKRYIFYVIEKRISDWHKAGCNQQKHCIALSGVRRIGKTTVLKQLHGIAWTDETYRQCRKQVNQR